ncbi:MAG TPA: DUF4294 domain-containing protein [Sphingobacteriaceae bacterium]|nr:DUF4294 domain-containing protein [Sphingobacteriaceae bacterium]
MKKFTLLLTLIVIMMSQKTSAQEKYNPYFKGKNDTIRVALTMVDNELIPWLTMSDVVISASRIFKSELERAKFNRLRYNVLKVLPYARFAKDRYSKLNHELTLHTNKKEQKILVKACEKEIKDMFNREIKNLTITQGEILIKLIDRETGYTTYQLAKDMKGGFNAFFYQSAARIFGHNLKEKYNPEEERDIESIIHSQTGYYKFSYN